MSSKIERQASASGTPRLLLDGSTPVRRITRGTVTTAEVWEIPASWKGAYVRFHLVGGTRAYIRFGTADTVLVLSTTTSGLASAVLSESATPKEPDLVIAPDAPVDEWIDPSWTHLAHVEEATGGYLRAMLKTAIEV